ncbi:DUF5671 domain-containing protein [Roseibaca sp. Y0-43]|uniref:DUF5671 domain-containing protein n=1 Tax=Roseibaca sp. Y0-43 TaxID=2816854 RepID=UPI001D0C13A1|nr:hypothetical protein [Roseibaca sp. Y0-43]
MKPADQLDAFVEAGLRAGHDPDALRGALLAEGWSPAEVAGALGKWADHGLGVPVPRPQAKAAGQDAVLYALMFVALLIVTYNLGDLGFELIEAWLPDPLHDPYYAGTTASMRWSIALLIVALPVFLWLDRRAARAVASDPGARRAPMRHRFGAFTMFLSMLALLGAAVAVVYAGLTGVITAQFLAKVGLVVVIAALVIAWFRDFLAEG